MAAMIATGRRQLMRRPGAVRDGMVAADAVVVEPVSAPKFPANREINREFFDFGLARGSEVAICPMIHWTWSKIPYSTEQGIFVKEQGIFTREQGILTG